MTRPSSQWPTVKEEAFETTSAWLLVLNTRVYHGAKGQEAPAAAGCFKINVLSKCSLIIIKMTHIYWKFVSIISLLSDNSPMKKERLLSPFHRWGNWVLVKLSALSTIKKLRCSRIRIQIRFPFFPNLVLSASLFSTSIGQKRPVKIKEQPFPSQPFSE